MKKLISAILAVVVSTVPVTAFAQTSLMPFVTPEIMKAEFFINKIQMPNKLLASFEEIEKINKDISNTKETHVANLLNFPKQNNTKGLLRNLATSIDFKEDFYIKDKLVQQTYYDNAKNNILKGEAFGNVKFAFCSRLTNLKAYPFNDILSDDAVDYEYDEFQSSSLQVGEPVVVLANTADKSWYYLQGGNCDGWAKASDIAVCDSREVWSEYINQKNVLVITANKFIIEENLYTPQLSGLMLTMGCAFPFANSAEIPLKIDGRATFGNYVVKIPTRKEDGSCDIKLALIPINRDVNIGYLPYTQENILKQIYKAQGDRYGWGGMLGANDCSQYVWAVYRSFGFSLPRNTTWQCESPVKKIDLAGYSDEEKVHVIKGLPVGTALYFPGHTMMLLGSDSGRIYVSSALGSVKLPGETQVTRVRSVVINTLDVLRANDKTWLSWLSTALVFQLESL